MKPRRSVNSSKVRDFNYHSSMLQISRSQAESFLESLQIVARHDSSNDDWVRYARNRIRHRVIPELKELNPQAISAIVRFWGNPKVANRSFESTRRPNHPRCFYGTGERVAT